MTKKKTKAKRATKKHTTHKVTTRKRLRKESSCSQDNSRDKKGRFQKGVSGNPSGKRIHSWRNELEDAIKTVEKRKRKKFMIHAIEQAYENQNVLVAILKKLLPDLKTEEIDAGANLKTFIDWLVGRSNGDSENKG